MCPKPADARICSLHHECARQIPDVCSNLVWKRDSRASDENWDHNCTCEGHCGCNLGTIWLQFVKARTTKPSKYSRREEGRPSESQEEKVKYCSGESARAFCPIPTISCRAAPPNVNATSAIIQLLTIKLFRTFIHPRFTNFVRISSTTINAVTY